MCLTRVGTVVLALIAIAAPVVAQVSSTTAAIVGTVTDNTQSVVPGVTVTLTGPALMGQRTVVTEPNGAYRFPSLPPGEDYKLVFELPGFSTVTREGINIRIGFTATVNTEMALAGMSEDITVSGASPVVDVTSTTVSTERERRKDGRRHGIAGLYDAAVGGARRLTRPNGRGGQQRHHQRHTTRRMASATPGGKSRESTPTSSPPAATT